MNEETIIIPVIDADQAVWLYSRVAGWNPDGDQFMQFYGALCCLCRVERFATYLPTSKKSIETHLKTFAAVLRAWADGLDQAAVQIHANFTPEGGAELGATKRASRKKQKPETPEISDPAPVGVDLDQLLSSTD